MVVGKKLVSKVKEVVKEYGAIYVMEKVSCSLSESLEGANILRNVFGMPEGYYSVVEGDESWVYTGVVLIPKKLNYSKLEELMNRYYEEVLMVCGIDDIEFGRTTLWLYKNKTPVYMLEIKEPYVLTSKKLERIEEIIRE